MRERETERERERERGRERRLPRSVFCVSLLWVSLNDISLS